VCNEKQAIDECRVVDVDAIKFHRCRAADPRGQLFTLNGCATGQLINIQSALLGYSITYSSRTNPPQCPDRNCTVPTDEPAEQCNGRQSCRISQTILLYGPGTQLCPIQRDGNFIEIEYTCVAGMTSISCLYVVHTHCDSK